MAQVPDLSPEWPPSSDQLAQQVTDLHWELQQVGYDLATRPHVTLGGTLPEMAAKLEALAHLLRLHDQAWKSTNRLSMEYDTDDQHRGCG